MEVTKAESDVHLVFSRTDGRGARRTSADERPSVASTAPRAIRTGVSAESSGYKEDWLPLASTDPALWLKEVDRWGAAADHRKCHTSQGTIPEQQRSTLRPST